MFRKTLHDEKGGVAIKSDHELNIGKIQNQTE